MLACIESSTRRQRFCSAPLVQLAVVAWRPLRASHGIIIPQQRHRGWGRFPSYRIITVYLMFCCSKFTLRDDLFATLPLQPSSGQSHGTAALRKDIQYVCGSSSGGVCLPLISHAHSNVMFHKLIYVLDLKSPSSYLH